MDNYLQRTCKCCGQSKPLTPKFFRRHSGNKNGFRWDCLDCLKIKKMSNKPVCSVDGCERKAISFSKGLCGMHLKRFISHGDTSYKTPKEIMAENSRKAKLLSTKAKDSTYKKYHNKHEHRVVAEQILGRTLKKGEVVHHIDKNKHNNDPSNLIVFKSQRDHVEWHLKNDPDFKPGRKKCS